MLRRRVVSWSCVLLVALSGGACAARYEHPLHRLAASDHNVVRVGSTAGWAGGGWPRFDLGNDPLRYDFGYQITTYPGRYSAYSYRFAHRAYTPPIYAYPNKGRGIDPYRHRPTYSAGLNLPRRQTHYPGVPGYRSHSTQNTYGYRSYGYRRSPRGPLGGVPRSGFGYRR